MKSEVSHAYDECRGVWKSLEPEVELVSRVVSACQMMRESADSWRGVVKTVDATPLNELVAGVGAVLSLYNLGITLCRIRQAAAHHDSEAVVEAIAELVAVKMRSVVLSAFSVARVAAAGGVKVAQKMVKCSSVLPVVGIVFDGLLLCKGGMDIARTGRLEESLEGAWKAKKVASEVVDSWETRRFQRYFKGEKTDFSEKLKKIETAADKLEPKERDKVHEELRTLLSHRIRSVKREQISDAAMTVTSLAAGALLLTPAAAVSPFIYMGVAVVAIAQASYNYRSHHATVSKIEALAERLLPSGT